MQVMLEKKQIRSTWYYNTKLSYRW